MFTIVVVVTFDGFLVFLDGYIVVEVDAFSVAI